MAAAKAAWRRIPRPVWALGLTSLFMDMASEAIHSLLPIFLTQTLGASAEVLGVLEGAAEGLTYITKLFSGLLSDRLGARKALTIAGYSLAGLSKPAFALAGSVPVVFAARLFDRFGKGIRGAPRDALITDLTPKDIQGAAFGLRQALDTVGAVAGPLGAIVLMKWLGFGIRAVFWMSVIPAALSVATLALGVKEPRTPKTAGEGKKTWRWRESVRMPVAFWAVVAAGSALTMARFSEAFLILRTQDQGLDVALIPLVLVVMNVVYTIVSYPAGALADRVRPAWLLAGGCLVLVGAQGALALGDGLVVTMSGVALWGMHMGLTQGVLSAMVAAAAPSQYRASAFGLFNVVVGIATIASSAIAGVLWQHLGPQATFISGGGFAVLALIATVAIAPFLSRSAPP